jgi:hypothetical protein
VELGKAVFTESRRGPGIGHAPDTRVAYRMGERSLAMAETKSRPAPRAALLLAHPPRKALAHLHLFVKGFLFWSKVGVKVRYLVGKVLKVLDI